MQRPGGDGRATANVVSLGELDPAALAAELGRASIFAAPARYEPFGQGALEAALAGCALVLGDVASLREVWGDAAMFVAPDDHDALRAALAALIEDPARRRSLAAQARTRALSFSPARMVDAYLAAYRAIAANRRIDTRIEEAACAS
jgi:glycosyltransferase involved in cell wall biosynthesis